MLETSDASATGSSIPSCPILATKVPALSPAKWESYLRGIISLAVTVMQSPKIPSLTAGEGLRLGVLPESPANDTLSRFESAGEEEGSSKNHSFLGVSARCSWWIRRLQCRQALHYRHF
ncbi:UNVERIFIED_CONTAM: hypothetical protein K2H54_019799 [Gekko kuhli]